MRDFEKINRRRISGQGFLEYALLLSVIALAIVVIAALGGSVFSNLYSRIMSEMFGGPILNVSAVRAGADIQVTITVSTPVTVTATDSQSGRTGSLSCSGTCSMTLAGVGSNVGVVTVTAPGGTYRAPYPR
jgi:hypothetical protein